VYISCAYYLYISVDVRNFWLPRRLKRAEPLSLTWSSSAPAEKSVQADGRLVGLRPGFLDLLPGSSEMEKKLTCGRIGRRD